MCMFKMLNGAGIFTNMYHKNHPASVSKVIHGPWSIWVSHSPPQEKILESIGPVTLFSSSKSSSPAAVSRFPQAIKVDERNSAPAAYPIIL